MHADSSGSGRVKVIGIAAGVLGVLLAVLVPLLPVQQHRASLDWPQPQALQLSAPLVDYVPLSLEASIPCTALRDMAGGTVLSTVPPQAPRAGSKGLVARIEDRPEIGRTLAVVLRDRLLLSVPLTDIGAPPPSFTQPPAGGQPGDSTGTPPGTNRPAAAPPSGQAGPPPNGATPLNGQPSGPAGSPGSTRPPSGTALPTGQAGPPPNGMAPPSGQAGLPSVPAGAPPGGAQGDTPAANCVAFTVVSTATRTTVELTGLRGADGVPVRKTVEGDVRPQVVGVFTEIDRGLLGDARLHAEIDARFSSSPSEWKSAAILGAVLCALIALICLHRGDLRDGRRSRRVLPARWWRFTGRDAVVAGTLVVWHVIGANSSDDGYILTMARASREAGYTANYYRWFQVAEAPFGWPYEVLAWMTRISDTGLWMRLPALLAGVVCWLVLSREVLPRLGSRVASNGAARWTAALVFLAAWLPFNNGLRPEPLIAVGALLTWCSMERAIATRRLVPAAIAVLIAAFSLAAGPTGLICLGALLAGSRPVLRTIIARARTGSGPALLRYAALLAPIAAAGTLVLVVVFADQTFASVLEATRVRQLVGPDMAWFEERTRWDSLLSVNPDGSLARRFGVLAMLGCLVVGVLVTLRHGGRIPATARGPVNRLLAVVFLALLLMMFTPTKWTHHFGVYAGLAAALAAVTAVALSRTVIRADYLRTLFAAAVLFLLAVSFTGSNGWWYVSGYGVPWPDRAPTLGGIAVSSLFLTATGLTLLYALWQYYRNAGDPRPVTEPVDTAEIGTSADDRATAPANAGAPAGTTPEATVATGDADPSADEPGESKGDPAGIESSRPTVDPTSAPTDDDSQAPTGATLGDSQNASPDDSIGDLAEHQADTLAGAKPNPLAASTESLSATATIVASGTLPAPGSRGRSAGLRLRLPAVAPLTIAAAAMVLFEVGSLASAAISQYPAYSVGLSNLRTLAGDRCAMADDVLVETNTADSLLTPYTGTVADGLAAENTGFTPNGVGSLMPDPGPGQSSAPPSGSGPAPGGAAGGGMPGGPGGAPAGPAPGGPGGPSGTGPAGGGAPGAAGPAVTGVNGSTTSLPFGLAPERTPVLGSYSAGEPQRSHLTTQWYRLDLAAAQQNPAYRVLILTIAGRIEGTGPDGSPMPGQRLRVEFASRAEDGTVTALGEAIPPTVGGAPGWRNLPIDLDSIPAGTSAVRLVAESGEPDPMRWLAVTPPRLPRLSTLNTLVGSTDPVLADWHVGLAFPCQRPFDHRDGVAELPIWRILPDKLNAQVSETWQGDTGGGPLGWTGMLMRTSTIPAYLAEDWTRDWGELQRLTRYVSAPMAEIGVRTEARWGWTGDSPIKTN
ncbi:arabinosyltransferase domain-containing protein [Nocardia sp. NPDC059177]|uniref:arabinosyltransferase domain-containing protein n=1 Tax=Nocardia sp. NPDC059177 TaxID=3346759 RepID=UPI00368A80B8